MSCDNVPTTAEIAQAKKDVNDFNTFMTSDADTFVDRNGVSRLTLQGAINKFGFGIADFTFTEGGTLLDRKLLVSNDPVDGFLYRYVGTGTFPITIIAGTNPDGNPDWEAFTATAAEFISNTNGGSVQDFIDAQYTTVADLATGKFPVGEYVRLKDRAMGLFLLKSGGTPTGGRVLDAGNGNTAEYQPSESKGVNVLHIGAKGDGVTDDDAMVLAAVDLCKATGLPLVIPNRVYNAALKIDWCIPLVNRDAILADPRYNPADPTQGTDVGLCFDVKMDSRAKFLKDSEISRVRGPVKMSLGQFQNKLIFCNLEKVNFSEGLVMDDVASMAYRSSNPASDRYPLQWFYWIPNVGLSNLSNGSCYWLSFKNLDATKGFILGGTTDDGYATNVIEFESCRLIGARDINTSGRESYIDNRGVGLYIEMTGGHTDGITLINCDLSYNKFPLWNNTNNPAQLIGTYYEGCTNNFFTQDGVNPSPRAANILNGFDYDRSNPNRNERTSLRANGFNISSRNGGGADYSSVNIEPIGGVVYVKDLDEETNIGALQNTQGQVGKAGTLHYLGFINSAQADESVYSFGERTGFLFDKSWAFIDIDALAASASASYDLVCTNTGADVNANGTIEVTVCGAPQGNVAGQPVVYKATVTKQGSDAWTVTTIYGSLTGERASISFVSEGANNNNLRVTVTNGAGSGSFTGTVHIETNITSSTRNPDGTYTRFRL